MSSRETSGRRPPGAELEETPEFDLECIYDDPENPAELTIFSPESEDLTTEWITTDRSTAVPLEKVV
ncbi:MAG: hypothetical protein ABEJ78_02655 [Haloferacaceae archaeon]